MQKSNAKPTNVEIKPAALHEGVRNPVIQSNNFKM